MAYQTGRQIEVVYKPETTFGALPPPQGAKVFRASSGNLSLSIEPIRSNENRRDGMTTRGRHGSRSVTGQYTGDLSVGTFDDLIEAALRGQFQPALAVNAAAMNGASVSVSANAITASAGSWINAGMRVGDVFNLAAGFAAANQNRNLRIIGLTSTVITVAETLTSEAGPIAAFTVNRPKKVIQGQVPRSFSFEERELDIDGSEIFKGVRVGSVQVDLHRKSGEAFSDHAASLSYCAGLR